MWDWGDQKPTRAQRREKLTAAEMTRLFLADRAWLEHMAAARATPPARRSGGGSGGWSSS